MHPRLRGISCVWRILVPEVEEDFVAAGLGPPHLFAKKKLAMQALSQEDFVWNLNRCGLCRERPRQPLPDEHFA